VTSAPTAINQDGHVVTYTLKVDHDAGTLHWARKLNVDIILLDPKYYEALRNFYEGVRTGDDAQVILQPATAATSN
jgi:hypothetical protein